MGIGRYILRGIGVGSDIAHYLLRGLGVGTGPPPFAPGGLSFPVPDREAAFIVPDRQASFQVPE